LNILDFPNKKAALSAAFLFAILGLVSAICSDFYVWVECLSKKYLVNIKYGNNVIIP
jgi:hypothetical protein